MTSCLRPSLVLVLSLLVAHQVGFAAEKISDQALASIQFDQKLDAQVSPALTFRDEAGREVKLGDYFGRKPVILVLGYYQCPMLCTLVLNGMVEALEDLKWTIGNQFDVINVSINPREGPSLAAAKKAAYLKRYGRTGAAAGWHFLTGNSDSVARLADQVGFRFAYDPASGEYAHPSGLVFLASSGKVVRYQFGVTFAPAQILQSLQQAQSGQRGSPVRGLVLLCFHYNPISGKYGLAIMMTIRLLALCTVIGLCWLIWRTIRAQARLSASAAAEPPPAGKEMS